MNDRSKMECSNPALQPEVYHWALTRGGSESEPSDAKLAEHIRSCPSCQQSVADWKRKAVAWDMWGEARRIVSGAAKPGEAVEMKAIPSGKAFFRHSTADQQSLLILVDAQGQIQSVDATATPADFADLSGGSD
jgi:hypothetical protein